MKFAGVLSRRLVSYLNLLRHGGRVWISDYMEMEISMAFITVKDLCVLSFFMRRNEHEEEGRVLVQAMLYHKHPVYLKHILSSLIKLYTHSHIQDVP